MVAVKMVEWLDSGNRFRYAASSLKEKKKKHSFMPPPPPPQYLYLKNDD